MARLTKDKLCLITTGMVGGSHSQKLFGDLTAWAEKNGHPTDDTETHTLFFYLLGNEVMVAEVQPEGFRLDSVEKYFGKDEYIVSVFDPILSPDQRDALVKDIQRRLRKDYDREYDLAGAMASEPFAKKVLWFVAPWLKEHPVKQFCSQVVAKILAASGARVNKLNPNPLELASWMRANPSGYRKIL